MKSFGLALASPQLVTVSKYILLICRVREAVNIRNPPIKLQVFANLKPIVRILCILLVSIATPRLREPVGNALQGRVGGQRALVAMAAVPCRHKPERTNRDAATFALPLELFVRAKQPDP
jgi:hypothetical protein